MNAITKTNARQININGIVDLATYPNGSSVTLMLTKRLTPKGGVIKATSALVIAIIPKWIRSRLKSAKVGISMGPKTSVREMRSIKQPAMKRNMIRDKRNIVFVCMIS